MQERNISAETKFLRATAAVATGIAVAEVFLGHSTPVDLVTSVALLNVYGVPVTPILQTIENSFANLRKQL